MLGIMAWALNIIVILLLLSVAIPDVMVHRILEQALNNNFIIDKKIEEKCKHCSDKERSSMEAERASNKYKQVEYMQNFLGDEFEE
jgi:ribonuclease R